MEGIDLRKATLQAAGWEIRKDYGPYQVWAAYMPNGQVYFVEFSEARVLEGCPAVESSVDEAMRWLTLPNGCYWQLDGPVSDPDTQGSSLASIVDINSSMERVTVGNPATPEEMKAAIKFNKPLAEADAETMSKAMCDAYLKLKSANL